MNKFIAVLLLMISTLPFGTSALADFEKGLDAYDREDYATALSGGAACVYSTVPTMQNRQCQVTMPCHGDHHRAMAQDDEIIFSIPREILQDIAEGLTHVDHKAGLATPLEAMPEYTMIESYAKAAKILGMETSK